MRWGRKPDDFSSAPRLPGGRLCGTGPDRGHLGPMIGRFDGGHDVPSDGRPGLEEVSRFFFDIQDRAVCRQPGIDLDGHVGHQGPAGGRGPGNHDLRFPFPNKMGQAGGVGLGQEMFELRGFHGQDAVRSALDQLLQVLLTDSVAQNDRS